MPVSDQVCQPPATGPGRAADPCVAVLSATGLRTLEAVLPAGFGFALIDGSGEILFHSDGSSIAETNLVDELGNGVLLTTELRQPGPGAGADFVTAYRDATQRFEVVALDAIQGVDWHLVMFYDQNSVVLPLLETAGVIVVIWLFGFGVLLTLFTWWRRSKPHYGVRRGGDDPGRTNRLSLGLAGAAAVLYALAMVALQNGLVLVGLLLGFVSTLALIGSAMWHLHLHLLDKTHVARPFVIAGLGLLLGSSVLPVHLLHQYVARDAVTALAKLNVDEYWRELAAQREIMREWKRRVAVPSVEQLNTSGRALGTAGIMRALRTDRATLAMPLTEPSMLSIWPVYSIFGEPLIINESTSKGTTGNFNLLAFIPDYSMAATTQHAMYRVPDVQVADVCLGKVSPATCGIDALRARMLEERVGDFAFYFWFVVTGVLLFALVLLSLWFLLVRTMGIRAEDFRRISNFEEPDKDAGAREIIYGLGEFTKRAFLKEIPEPRSEWLDLRLVAVSTPVQNLGAKAGADVVILDHFDDFLTDPAVLKHRVALLEHLVRSETRSVILLNSIDPLNFVTASYDVTENAALISRFATLLSRFRTSYFQESPPPEPGATDADLTLYEECFHPNLKGIRESLLDHYRTLERDEIIQQVGSRANAIYQHMWSLCTRVEKLTLIELAHGNVVNPNNWDAARRLKQRGYLRRDPFHRVFNESFTRFILRMERIEDVDSWRAENPGMWASIRLPLVVAALGGIVFLGVTQPAFFNSAFAFAAAGTAGLPFLTSLLVSRLNRSSEKA